ncbi:hypothetical protein AGMMS49992_25330 [Clostridia bacterium]|nr:hypothetical protein AGMMS49992_25330 [Clostridia bacterium]
MTWSASGYADKECENHKIPLYITNYYNYSQDLKNNSGTNLRPKRSSSSSSISLTREAFSGCTLPGIDTLSASQILSEIGADMSVFETSKHLTK